MANFCKCEILHGILPQRKKLSYRCTIPRIKNTSYFILLTAMCIIDCVKD